MPPRKATSRRSDTTTARLVPMDDAVPQGSAAAPTPTPILRAPVLAAAPPPPLASAPSTPAAAPVTVPVMAAPSSTPLQPGTTTGKEKEGGGEVRDKEKEKEREKEREKLREHNDAITIEVRILYEHISMVIACSLHSRTSPSPSR